MPFVPDRNLSPQGSWNLSATLFWSLTIGAIFIGIQSGISYLYYRFTQQGAAIDTMPLSGLLVSLATISTTIVCGALIVYLASKTRVAIRDYLALKSLSLVQVMLWLAALLVFSYLSNVVASYFEHDVGSNFAQDLYQNAGNIYLLAFAIVFAAPVFEELFFRGFIYRGFADSRLGVAGAIVITALLWTLLHGQYDWYTKINIFALGILFGIARFKSGSILSSLLMHMLMNGMTLAEVANL